MPQNDDNTDVDEHVLHLLYCKWKSSNVVLQLRNEQGFSLHLLAVGGERAWISLDEEKSKGNSHRNFDPMCGRKWCRIENWIKTFTSPRAQAAFIRMRRLRIANEFAPDAKMQWKRSRNNGDGEQKIFGNRLIFAISSNGNAYGSDKLLRRNLFIFESTKCRQMTVHNRNEVGFSGMIQQETWNISNLMLQYKSPWSISIEIFRPSTLANLRSIAPFAFALKSRINFEFEFN